MELSLLKTVRNSLALLPHSQYWQIPKEGAVYLYNTVLHSDFKLILEVGTSSGYSSLWIVEAILRKSLPGDYPTFQPLITVESNPKRHQFATDNFKKAQVGKYILPVLGHAPEVFHEILFPAPIDFIFLDATKSQTISFLEEITPYMNPKAEILIDNINSHSEKMQPTLNYLTANNYNFKIIKLGAGMAHIKL